LHRIIIPGPPGTGKTYRLTEYLKKELNEHKTDAQKIIYISFSNAAAREANKRIDANLYFIGTMHSLGNKELKYNTKTGLLKGNKWKGFKTWSQICRDLSFESRVNEFGYVEYTNPHMKIIEYSRSRQIDIQEAAIELDLSHSVDLWLTEQIEADLEIYKNNTKMFEYYNMIADFIKKEKCPSLDAVFLDEAQDLSPLQWKMFFYIESKCKRSYIAGDDDQTIYTFQGADPSIFINLKGEVDPQIQSRRVPKKIHQLAISIFPYMTNRLEKKWNPRDAEGEIHENVRLDEIDLSEGNWMILTRTNKMLEPIKEYLYGLNLRFSCKNQDLLSDKMLEAFRTWHRLNNGASVSQDEVKNLYDYLNYKKGHVKYGFSGGKSLNTIYSADIETLQSEHGLRVAGSWELLDFSEESKSYISNLIDSGDDLMKEPRIKISTIHSVKGEECENVILYTDITKIIYHSALKDPDPEHRTFFVGITRTKERLYLVEPMQEYQYNIGGPLV